MIMFAHQFDFELFIERIKNRPWIAPSTGEGTSSIRFSIDLQKAVATSEVSRFLG